MTKSFANGNEPVLGYGNALPAWLRHNQEYLMAWREQFSSWTEMA